MNQGSEVVTTLEMGSLVRGELVLSGVKVDHYFRSGSHQAHLSFLSEFQ